MSENSRILVDQKQALSVYLEALLREPVLELEEPAVESERVPEPIAPVAPVVVAHLAGGDEIPEWGRERFQAMLFRVAGLTLAVPLAELSGVLPWDATRLTPMPGHVPWYLGLTPYRERNVPVVDTARLVLPEDRLAGLGDPRERIGRVVFIDDGRWGLACDEIAQVVVLQPDQVRWRTHRTKRRWLAGTVVQQMCALIDPPAFAQMLATGMEDAEAGQSPAGGPE